MLRRLPGRKVSGQMQKRTHIMPVMGGRTGKDGKRQMGLAIAFIICAQLASITMQIVVGTVLMEKIQKLRGEQYTIWKNQKKILLKQLDTIQTTGNIQNEQLKVVLKQLVARIEQEKKVSECYEKIEEITQQALNHAQAIVEENERLRRENTVLATAYIGRKKLLALKNTSRKNH